MAGGADDFHPRLTSWNGGEKKMVVQGTVVLMGRWETVGIGSGEQLLYDDQSNLGEDWGRRMIATRVKGPRRSSSIDA